MFSPLSTLASSSDVVTDDIFAASGKKRYLWEMRVERVSIVFIAQHRRIRVSSVVFGKSAAVLCAISSYSRSSSDMALEVVRSSVHGCSTCTIVVVYTSIEYQCTRIMVGS